MSKITVKFIGTKVSKKNNFEKALISYYNDLSEGNYDTLKYYTQPHARYYWRNEDELAFIKNLLETNGILKEIYCSYSFHQRLDDLLPVGLPLMVNLLNSLTFLEKQQNLEVGAEKEFENINDQERLIAIEAGMSGPCLAYLGALRLSDEDNVLKVLTINDMLIGILNRTETVGNLDKILFNLAFDYLTQLFEEANGDDEELIELKETFTKDGDLSAYKDKCNEYGSIKEIFNNICKSKIEFLILIILEKLKNDIGKLLVTLLI